VPFAIGPFPEDVPEILDTNILQLGDGFLGVFTGTIECRTHDEKLNGLVSESLSLTYLISQVQGRTAT